MKMSKNGLCCDRCFELIAEKDPGAALLWIELCRLHLHASIFGLETEEDESLRLLENLGLITTTETNEIIIIRVNGFQKEGAVSFYCGGHCE